MKRLLFVVATLIFIGSPGSSYDLPAPSQSPVADLARIINPERLIELETIFARLEKQTGVEMAVVTIPSLHTQRADVDRAELFTSDLFKQWGIGHKNTNTGVLVLVSMKDRLVRFEFGTDFASRDFSIVSQKYERSVLPFLESKNYSEGVFVAAMLAAQVAVEDVSWWWYHRIALILFGLAFVVLIGIFYAKKRNLQEGLWAGLPVFVLLVALALIKFTPDYSRLGFGGGSTQGAGVTHRWRG